MSRADRGKELLARAACAGRDIAQVDIPDPVVILGEWLDADGRLCGEAMALGEGKEGHKKRKAESGNRKAGSGDFIVRAP